MDVPKQIKEALTAGEEVICVAETRAIAHPTSLVVTNKRAIMLETRMLGRFSIVGIPYSKISHAYGKKGKMTGTIKIIGEEGEQEIVVEKVKNATIPDLINTMKNELNKVAIEPITVQHKKNLFGGEWYFYKPKENVVRSVTGPAPHAMEHMDSPNTGIEQLRELKQLVDEGILTEDEYNRKKEEVLKRM